MIKKFETSKTYETRSICDHNCIFKMEVIKRTAKTLTIRIQNEIKRVRIYIYENSESVKPLGNYSMAPIMRAEREVA
jgi:hypothetical protein